jgi:hypothetical protein
MHALSLVFAVSLLPQDPSPPSPPDLRELAARVDAAHRPDGPVPPITAFKSTVKLEVVDKAAPQGGEVELEVQFLLWKPPGRDREQALIKYQLKEAGPAIVRGRDREGYWQLFQNEAKDLRGAEFEQDLAACRKHTNLARQLVQFLDPGAVLRSLQQPSPVREEELRFHEGEERGAPVRGTKTPCFVVEGRLPSFPLLQHGGDDAPVHLKVFVSKATSRLLAVEATPIVGGKPDAASMERVNLLDPKLDAGLLVPRKLAHYFTANDGSMRLQSRVLLSPTLRPELRVEDFDRPTR